MQQLRVILRVLHIGGLVVSCCAAMTYKQPSRPGPNPLFWLNWCTCALSAVLPNCQCLGLRAELDELIEAIKDLAGVGLSRGFWGRTFATGVHQCLVGLKVGRIAGHKHTYSIATTHVFVKGPICKFVHFLEDRPIPRRWGIWPNSAELGEFRMYGYVATGGGYGCRRQGRRGTIFMLHLSKRQATALSLLRRRPIPTSTPAM